MNMRKILENILKFFAAKILKKYNPKVIGITGSVGKTSTKEAIFTVLSPHFNVRKNEKNYNNEIGLPLTIIGAKTGGKSLFLWLGVFLKAIWLILFRDKNYPEILILEMAADKPGDIRYFLKFIKLNIAVVTAVAPVHLEQFKDIEKIAKEKSKIVSELDANGIAILNFDDEKVREMQNLTKAKVLTFGFDEKADLRCLEFVPGSVSIEENNIKTIGVTFKILYSGKAIPVHIPNVLGRQQIYAALAAALVGLVFDLNLLQISESLMNYKAPRGRMNVIPGIKNTIIIDDSYNASPRSTIAALDVLSSLPIGENSRKFAVLGDMLELGTYTAKAHREIGKVVVDKKIDYLITIGPNASLIADEAERLGMSIDNIFSFDNSEEAGRFLQDRIKQGDIILVKGSRAMKTEKVVKEIMAEPLRADELLVS
jgi:UDP-N-acetylmuramoyl-tripeptide--D-alanyl-D-alanine ligase